MNNTEKMLNGIFAHTPTDVQITDIIPMFPDWQLVRIVSYAPENTDSAPGLVTDPVATVIYDGVRSGYTDAAGLPPVRGISICDSRTGSMNVIDTPVIVFSLYHSWQDNGSSYAAEGTEAHTLCEYKLKTALGIRTKDPTTSLTYYSEEMEQCANGYAAYIMELVETAKQNCADPVVLIDQRLDFSKYVEGGFGTGDCVIIADGTLHIVDYKHGQGVLIESDDNPQMKLYALGALELFDGIYDIDTVSMTIYQPRRDNISTHTVFKESLYQWAAETLKPIADLAYDGKGEFRCGDWCQFCKAKHDCRKRAEQNLELAKYEFKLPPLLEDDEIESIGGRKIGGYVPAYRLA